jgi:hypothetical protein
MFFLRWGFPYHLNRDFVFAHLIGIVGVGILVRDDYKIVNLIGGFDILGKRNTRKGKTRNYCQNYHKKSFQYYLLVFNIVSNGTVFITNASSMPLKQKCARP